MMRFLTTVVVAAIAVASLPTMAFCQYTIDDPVNVRFVNGVFEKHTYNAGDMLKFVGAVRLSVNANNPGPVSFAVRARIYNGETCDLVSAATEYYTLEPGTTRQSQWNTAVTETQAPSQNPPSWYFCHVAVFVGGELVFQGPDSCFDLLPPPPPR